MTISIEKSAVESNAEIAVSGSKSETNRLLLLQALFPEIVLSNVSSSDDSLAMKTALESDADIIDIGHAGTAMRFLTAYFSILHGRTVTLTGSPRMQQRPIGILVDALRSLGAEIEYLGKDGFPPLKITGKTLSHNQVAIRADVSSQFISALMMIAPKLANGLKMTLQGDTTSRPYIEMTFSLLKQIGVRGSMEGNAITIAPSQIPANVTIPITVESDWSSASYFYSIVALSEIGTEITLSNFIENSRQGDRVLVDFYKKFGVETNFSDGKITIRKTENCHLGHINHQLNDTPDLAQTIAVTAFGLGIDCKLDGLHTLKIKETDRLLALKTELGKLGAKADITDDSISVKAGAINSGIAIETYDDHRMAMAFAPLALKVPIEIRDAQVVAKSFPTFWDDLKAIGFRIKSE